MPDVATEGLAEHSSRLQPSISLHAPVTAFMCHDVLREMCVARYVLCYNMQCHDVLFVTMYCLSRCIVCHDVLCVTMYCVSRCIVCHDVLCVTMYCVSRCIVCHDVLCVTMCCVSRCIVCHDVLCGMMYVTVCVVSTSDRVISSLVRHGY